MEHLPSILIDTPLHELPRAVVYRNPPPIEEFDFKNPTRPLTAMEISFNAFGTVCPCGFFLPDDVDFDRLSVAIDTVHSKLPCISVGIQFVEGWWRYMASPITPTLKRHDDVLEGIEALESRMNDARFELSTHQLVQWHLYPVNIDKEGFTGFKWVLLFFVAHSLMGGSSIGRIGSLVNLEYMGVTEWSGQGQLTPSLPNLLAPEEFVVPELPAEVKDKPIALFPHFDHALYTNGHFREPNTPRKSAITLRSVPYTAFWRKKPISLTVCMSAVTLLHSAAYSMLERKAAGKPIGEDEEIDLGFSVVTVLSWLFKHYGENGWNLIGNNFGGTPTCCTVTPKTTVMELAEQLNELTIKYNSHSRDPDAFLKGARAGLRRPVEVREHSLWAWAGYFGNLGVCNCGEGPLRSLFGSGMKSYADPHSTAYVNVGSISDPISKRVMCTLDVPDESWPAKHGGEKMLDMWLALCTRCKETDGAVSILDMMDTLAEGLGIDTPAPTSKAALVVPAAISPAKSAQEEREADLMSELEYATAEIVQLREHAIRAEKRADELEVQLGQAQTRAAGSEKAKVEKEEELRSVAQALASLQQRAGTVMVENKRLKAEIEAVKHEMSTLRTGGASQEMVASMLKQLGLMTEMVLKLEHQE
eukprot:gnl/Dysnectes_brevis/6327_a9746_415.p1 GENE.gnl/Dysnectes_brevis/6327_a9746_415~~gnl/Dysnectes_brevis/6327_a9746_415.p1  ORF type:complete len:645 (+),score=218.77 gnl/Dysnectes_brevis/6327_a9746_415:51-1985(+)